MVDFTVASRYSDYSTFGSTTNSKFGVLVQPTADLKVRATFAEGFRAPSIGALYSGNSDSYPDLQDPCDVNAANFTGNADGTQVGQCLADGVPAGFTQPNTQIRITVGGNPNVMPEESESFNVGLVWQPSGVQGLNMFADYYDIEITNLISSIGAQLLLNGCYTGSNPGYCGAIDRLSTGFVDDLRDTTNNVGTLVTSGVEVGGSYGFATAYGDFVLSVDARSLPSLWMSACKSSTASCALMSPKSSDCRNSTQLTFLELKRKSSCNSNSHLTDWPKTVHGILDGSKQSSSN